MLAPSGGDGREETPLERWDRNFGELLQELRGRPDRRTGAVRFPAHSAVHQPVRAVVRVASRMAMLGLAALLVAMLGAVYLAVDVVVGSPLVGILVGGLAALYVFLWYVLPFLGRRQASGTTR